MPKFAKGSKEAKEYMASIRAKRGGAKGKGIEGGGKKFDFFDDLIIPIGKKSGDPFKKSVGVNPFEAGFKFGRDTVAPALMKVIPPPKRRGKGMSPASIPPAPYPANRDLTPEMVGGRMNEMEYCPCSHCGGMGIKKKTRM